MKILITGAAGFIGFHVANLLLSEGCFVHGYDAITDYYDINLKRSRLRILQSNANFSFNEALLEDTTELSQSFDEFMPDVVVHLAAQAGVRYSLKNPRAYIETNLVGTFNILEECRRLRVSHLLMASTSSVYGANESMPFRETDFTETPMTIYAATKKANENMGHSYSHLYQLPITAFRFFTVYGPWGRPDMALFKFTKGILNGTPIDIYNNGDMYRDFTFVDDLVRSIRLLIDKAPVEGEPVSPRDTLSPVAPHRVVNIGNGHKVRLLTFVEAIEKELGVKAIKNYMPMQVGDVLATWADADLLKALVGYQPSTHHEEGVASFVSWYREYYRV